MTLLLAQKLLRFKHFSHWRPIQKVMHFEKCITSPFKVDLNIFVICKIIKIKILTKGNQNIHKSGTTKNTHKETIETK